MRFIRFHALVHFLSPVNASSDSPHIYLTLVSVALFGVGQLGRFSSHMFYTHPMAQLESAHWFFLQRVLKTPWNFGKNFSNPLHYWGFPFLIFFARHVYWGNSESGQKMLYHWQFPRELLRFSFRMIFSAVSALVSRFLISTRLSGSVIFGIFIPFSPCFLWGSPKFSEGLLCSREQCTGKSATCLLFPSYCER